MLQQLNTLIDAFYLILLKLNGDNFKLCGSATLVAHGLKIGRDVSDLDVAIYKPTPEQVAVLEGLLFFNLSKSNNSNYSGNSNTGTVVLPAIIKIKKDNYFMDIHLETNDCSSGCLYHKHYNTFFKINPISATIAAKASYTLRPDNSTIPANYCRKKDAVDFQNLKVLNFNY